MRWIVLGGLWSVLVVGAFVGGGALPAGQLHAVLAWLLLLGGWGGAIVTSFVIRGEYDRRMGIRPADRMTGAPGVADDAPMDSGTYPRSAEAEVLSVIGDQRAREASPEGESESLPVIGPRPFGTRIGYAWPSTLVAKAEEASAAFLHDGEQLVVFTPAAVRVHAGKRPRWYERGRLAADFLALTDRRLLLFSVGPLGGPFEHTDHRMLLADEFPRSRVRLLSYRTSRLFGMPPADGDRRDPVEARLQLETPDGRLFMHVTTAWAERQEQIARAFSHDDVTVHIPDETPSVVGTTVFVIIMTAVWVVIILGVVGVIH